MEVYVIVKKTPIDKKNSNDITFNTVNAVVASEELANECINLALANKDEDRKYKDATYAVEPWWVQDTITGIPRTNGISVHAFVEQTQLNKAMQVLKDNGIDEDECEIVLQALGYALLDTELFPTS